MITLIVFTCVILVYIIATFFRGIYREKKDRKQNDSGMESQNKQT